MQIKKTVEAKIKNLFAKYELMLNNDRNLK